VRTKSRIALVCEDNPSIRLLLKLFFEKRGWTAVLAEDGVDAVPLFKQHNPAVIVLDVIMPGKDGIHACADLRAAGVTVPVVMLTSKNYDSDRKRAMEAGATAYVLKPFNPQDLERVISPLLPT
jgi:DNA-binding response OmpR family regulator